MHAFTPSPSWRQTNGGITNIYLPQPRSLSWAVVYTDRRRHKKTKQAPSLPRSCRFTIQMSSLHSPARLPASSKLPVQYRTAAYSVWLTPSFRDPAHSQICLSATIMCIYYSEEISTYSWAKRGSRYRTQSLTKFLLQSCSFLSLDSVEKSAVLLSLWSLQRVLQLCYGEGQELTTLSGRSLIIWLMYLVNGYGTIPLTSCTLHKLQPFPWACSYSSPQGRRDGRVRRAWELTWCPQEDSDLSSTLSQAPAEVFTYQEGI